MTNKKSNLSDAVRNNLVQHILTFYKHGHLPRGVISQAAKEFGVHRRTATTLWKQAREMQSMGLPIYLTNRKSGTIRKKYKIFDSEFFKTILLKKRSTIRRAAKALGVGKTTFWRWKQTKQVRAHTNAIKITLSSAQKLKRLLFCLQALEADTETNKLKFKSMYHIVHIDEKWFYLTKTAERYYLSADEPDPNISLCRPIYDADGLCIFDGKIGMYPFTEQVAAVRSSINRPAGTYETKAIPSITREVMKDMMINQVLPDLKAMWPLMEDTHIVIQQDNARPHLSDSDPEWRAAASADGFYITLIEQPALSPDLNVNDLGWFRALQSLQEESSPINVDELVLAVLASFEDLEPMKLNFVYLSLQTCMVEIMQQRGHNNYRVPHMIKQTLLREGTLPVDLEVDTNLVSSCVDYCIEAGLGEEVMHVSAQLMKLHAEAA